MIGMGDDHVTVPVLVWRGLKRCRDRRVRLASTVRPVDRAAYLRRVAETFRQEARWWDVLTKWQCGSEGLRLSPVFVDATVSACAYAESFAVDYQHMADDQAERVVRRGMERAA